MDLVALPKTQPIRPTSKRTLCKITQTQPLKRLDSPSRMEIMTQAILLCYLHCRWRCWFLKEEHDDIVKSPFKLNAINQSVVG